MALKNLGTYNAPAAMVQAIESKVLLPPNSRWSRYLLETKSNDLYKKEYLGTVLSPKGTFAGTFFFHGAKGKPLEKVITKLFEFQGKKKLIDQHMTASLGNSPDKIFFVDFGPIGDIENGRYGISIINKSTWKRVVDLEGLDRGEEFSLEINSRVIGLEVLNRGPLNYVELDGQPTRLSMSEQANIGLLIRRDNSIFIEGPREINAVHGINYACEVFGVPLPVAALP